MKTILFPTDFSQTAKNTEKFAIEIAKQKNAKLIILHVEDEVRDSSFLDSSSDDSVEVITKNSPMQRMRSILKSNELELYPHTLLVESGEVIDTILNTIKEQNVDLVIIGTDGNNDFERNNSNTAEIIRKAKCSVLAVPKDAVYRPVLNIVYATDLIHIDGQSFLHLVTFAKAFDADITLLHINIDGKDKPGKSPLKTFSEILEEIPYSKIDTEVIVAASLVEGLEDYAKENDIDVIAMTTHSRSFLDKFFRSSNTRKMALSTHLPLLTFSK